MYHFSLVWHVFPVVVVVVVVVIWRCCSSELQDDASLGLGWIWSFDAVLRGDEALVQQPLGRTRRGCDLPGLPLPGGCWEEWAPHPPWSHIRLMTDQRLVKSLTQSHPPPLQEEGFKKWPIGLSGLR